LLGEETAWCSLEEEEAGVARTIGSGAWALGRNGRKCCASAGQRTASDVWRDDGLDH
jgi:hypothetical protein